MDLSSDLCLDRSMNAFQYAIMFLALFAFVSLWLMLGIGLDPSTPLMSEWF